MKYKSKWYLHVRWNMVYYWHKVSTHKTVLFTIRCTANPRNLSIAGGPKSLDGFWREAFSNANLATDRTKYLSQPSQSDNSGPSIRLQTSNNDVKLAVIRICYVVIFKVLYCALQITTEDKHLLAPIIFLLQCAKWRSLLESYICLSTSFYCKSTEWICKNVSCMVSH